MIIITSVLLMDNVCIMSVSIGFGFCKEVSSSSILRLSFHDGIFQDRQISFLPIMIKIEVETWNQEKIA